MNAWLACNGFLPYSSTGVTILLSTWALHQQMDKSGYMLDYVIKRWYEQLSSPLRRLMRPAKESYFTEEKG